jgi:hypothetical protein
MNSSTNDRNLGASRRDFLHKAGVFTAAAAVLQSDWVRRVLVTEAQATEQPNLVPDTFNGLAAFIVPGDDPYSVHQGVNDTNPGAVAACTGFFLVATLNLINVPPPPAPSFAIFVASILNSVAAAANPAATGPFDSPFANLSFAEKGAAFAIMESGQAGPEVAPLAGILPALTASIAYSEAGLLSPAFCTLNGTPVGWAISGYQGVADGRDDFKGYFQNRRSAVREHNVIKE